ncbi:D-glucuronyl C5-epimerase family protein [Aeromonas caviae]
MVEFETLNIDDIDADYIYDSDEVYIYKQMNKTVRIDCVCNIRKNSKNIIVFMPSAQPKKDDIKNPIFHRWSWSKYLNEESIITFSDPSLYGVKLHGSWFISNDENVDYIDEMAIFLMELLTKLNIHENNIIIYGSSMGGFGALMLSSKLNNAYAIAEVPQLNLLNYPYKSSIYEIEKTSIHNTLDNFYIKHPERIDVYERFQKESYIPPFTILTNREDNEIQAHLDFISKLTRNGRNFNYSGDINISVNSRFIGHRPLDTPISIKIIKSRIVEGWNVVNNRLEINKQAPLFFSKEINEIHSRIPTFLPHKHDYRNIDYIPDGEFAHLKHYSINGADPLSDNKVTQVNGGLKAWSIWHNSGRTDEEQLKIAKFVGMQLIDAQLPSGEVPLNQYNSGYHSYNHGWISGIQLKNVALWARLWSIEDDHSLKSKLYNAIYAMLECYLRPISEGGVISSLSDVDSSLSCFLLPQEYPIPGKTKQRHVINGAQFAVLSILDAAFILDDAELKSQAMMYEEALFEAANLATWDGGTNIVTSYGLEYYTGLSEKPVLGNAPYHITHCVLGAILYKAFDRGGWLSLTNKWINSIQKK